MRLTVLKQPRFYVPLGLVVILAAASAVVFNPAFQKKLLLDHVGPRVDSLQIGSVHLTPWSLDLHGIAVGYRGGRFQLEHGSIRFCLASLLWLNLDIESIALEDVQVDLQEFRPPHTQQGTQQSPDQTGPFPGVLAALEHGLSYTVQRLKADAEVRLPGQQSLQADVTGSGIRPGGTGGVYLALRFNTGKEDDHIDLDSSVYLKQRTRGRFAALDGRLAIQAALAALPNVEHADVILAVTPAPVREDAPAVTADAGGQARHLPERLRLTLRQNDSTGENRSTLELQGTYDGNNGGFDGGYRVTANERLVQPYAGDNRIPPAEEVLNGELNFNLADLTGDMTVIGDMTIRELRETQANARLPERLRLKNNFRLSLLPGMQLRVETLDSGLTDETERTSLTTKLPAELKVPLRNIDGFLHQENTLLEFELPVVPLTWFDVFLPDQDITAGTLTGAFAITTDSESAIHLKPLKPLTIAGLCITQGDGTQYRDLNLSALPGATYSGEALRVSLDKLAVDAGKGTLATASVSAKIPLSADRAGTVDAKADVDLDMRHLASFLAGKTVRDRNLPRHMAVAMQTRLRQQTGRMVISQLDATVTRDGDRRLLNLQLQQPLIVEKDANGTRLRNDSGKLATLAVSDIRLGWFSGLVPGTTLQGSLHRANLLLTAEAAGSASLTASGPLRIDNVSVTGRNGALLEQLGVSLRPTLRLSADGTTITYRDLAVTGDKTRLVSGHGRITLPGAEKQPLQADGRLEADLQALSRQPLLARALQASITAPVRLEADYRLSQGSSSIDIRRLSARVFYGDPEPRVSFQADSRVRVRTSLGRRQSELGRARGKVTLTIANLTPEPFAGILAANGLAFRRADGKAVLSSDGRSMTVDTVEPLVITGLAVKSGADPLLHPFTLTADTATRIAGDELHASLKRFSMAFERDKGAHALDGTIDLVLKGHGDAIRAETLDADLKVLLPSLLDQPAVLPGHTLTAGELTTVARLNPDGKLVATARVHDLKARQKLPLRSLLVQVDGHIDRDGSFDLSAPVTTQGKSGESSVLTTATYSVKHGANDDVALTISSPVFYLNDILNTLNAIAGTSSAAGSTDQARETAAEAADDTRPDARAFWDRSGYNARITFNMDHLYYTDYLDIQDISAHAEMTHARLALRDFEAHFHDSPLTADGTLNFTGSETPYDLTLKAGVRQFDLARFFRELAPGSKPQAEGLFDVSIDAFGRSPNMAQYRNNLYFDARLHSGRGLFRLLDPDSPLVSGSTGLASGIGEVVSYVPTGLFGLGAVSRLVNYIKEIDYDKIDIHLARDASRNVQIKEYVVQSPGVLLTASGGIEYQEGVDILQSPLALDAQLSLRDEGAAIFYALDLLKSKQDTWGYWKGPSIRFRGTPANPESNLDDIISDAGRGAILGAIIRPIAGLIGNIRHRWFDEDKPAVEYTTGDKTDTGQTPPQ